VKRGVVNGVGGGILPDGQPCVQGDPSAQFSQVNIAKHDRLFPLGLRDGLDAARVNYYLRVGTPNDRATTSATADHQTESGERGLRSTSSAATPMANSVARWRFSTPGRRPGQGRPRATVVRKAGHRVLLALGHRRERGKRGAVVWWVTVRDRVRNPDCGGPGDVS